MGYTYCIDENGGNWIIEQSTTEFGESDELEYQERLEQEAKFFQEAHMRNHAALGSDLEEIIKNFLNRAGSEDLGCIYQSYPRGKPYCEIERGRFLKNVADAFHYFQEREGVSVMDEQSVEILSKIHNIRDLNKDLKSMIDDLQKVDDIFFKYSQKIENLYSQLSDTADMMEDLFGDPMDEKRQLLNLVQRYMKHLNNIPHMNLDDMQQRDLTKGRKLLIRNEIYK